MSEEALYDDGRIRCDATGVRIGWYYPWGAKLVPYSSIRSVRSFPLGGVSGRYRIWGSGDLRHWYNLDTKRPKKATGLELTTGSVVRPVITPDDPAQVEQILATRIGT